MDSLLKLFDRLTRQIPPQILFWIRVGAFVIWFAVAAVVVVFFSRKGTDATPQQGQDLYLLDIKEKARKDLNRQKSPDVTIPDIQELLPESSGGLSGNQERMTESFNRVEQEKETASLPPFLGERTDSLYPSVQESPSKDVDVGETRSEIKSKRDTLSYPKNQDEKRNRAGVPLLAPAGEN